MFISTFRVFRVFRGFFFLSFLPASFGLSAAPLTFQSSAKQTALLELFTSEGCSSCPPAETWLSGLKQSPGLWKDFVPLAFHVDYWDYLGWRDPWASKSFSERQRAYASQWRTDPIYTPGFALNGKEWRDWSERTGAPKPGLARAGVLTVSSSDTNRWRVTFAPANPIGPECEVHAALLACGLSSDVKAGENRGHRLNHDFVVTALTTHSLKLHGNNLEGEFELNPANNSQAKRLALAVWVTPPASLQPIQATGGWLLAAP